MKKWIILMLLVLCFSGCASRKTDETTAPTQQETVPVTEPGLYVPESTWETDSQGALRFYQVEEAADAALLEMDQSYALIAVDSATTVTVLRGEDLHPAQQMTLQGTYAAKDWQISADKKQLAYFDREKAQILLFDAALNQIEQIKLPEDAVGAALLSSDFTKVYYGTETAVRVIEVDKGITRLLREGSAGVRTLLGLEFGDTVLRLTLETETALLPYFIDTQTGADADIQFSAEDIWTTGQTGYFIHSAGMVDAYVFGVRNGTPKQLQLTQLNMEPLALADLGQVLTGRLEDAQLVLETYDLNSGKKTARIALDESFCESYITQSADGKLVWILDGTTGTLLRWEPAKSPFGDAENYITPSYTAEDPDIDGIRACQTRAADLGEALGIKILLWDDTESLQHQEYTFENGYHPAVFNAMLDALEAAAELLPEGFLKQVSDCNPAKPLTIALVHDIRPASGEGEDPRSLQFWGSDRNYMVLESGTDMQQLFFRELYHAIDVALLNSVTDFDFWGDQNPSGADYTGTPSEDSAWLEGENPAFLDAAAMRSPTEDRASVFVYAMQEDDCFAGSIQQSKLKSLCKAIRKIFDLPETVIWEQHLVTE